MRIGTITYATNRGLSHLARDFYRHGVITDVMVMEHSSIPTNRDWYPGAPVNNIRRMNVDQMKEFVAPLDVLLVFETPFWWGLFDYCRSLYRPVKTFLVTMYECTPVNHVRPDVYLCPSVLDMQYFSAYQSDIYKAFFRLEGVGATRGLGNYAIFTPLPVEYPWRLRERAEHFVHNGGYLGVKTRRGGVMREGTTTLIEAMEHVKSPIRLTIRVQENVPPAWIDRCRTDPRIEYLPRQMRYEELYGEGDVCVGAQRWNGCSLPLQEALASGMLVMNTDRFPTNTWLPREPLVPPRDYLRGVSIGGPYMTFDEAVVDPRDLAAKIDRWYKRDITEFSLRGKAWAKENSWERLKPKWMEVLSL